MGTPKLATGVKSKDSPGNRALRFSRLPNSAYLGEKKHQKSEIDGTFKIILPGICCLPRLVPLMFPLKVTGSIHFPS